MPRRPPRPTLFPSRRSSDLAPTKENVQQARAVPAQHGAAASQGLKGVRKVAKSSALPLPIQGRWEVRKSELQSQFQVVCGLSLDYSDERRDKPACNKE